MKKQQQQERQEQNMHPMAGIVERNIKALIDRRIKEERKKSFEERIADTFARFTGNMAFIYTHLAIFGIWICWNLGLLGVKPFDPDLNALQVVTELEAIFLTTFVLMSQNSLDAQADKRADLDLQISLLAEHEITRLLHMVKAIAQKLDIEEAKNEEIIELSEDVQPETILERMENEKESRISSRRENNGQS
jgi:uncharacterized membrane protein